MMRLGFQIINAGTFLQASLASMVREKRGFSTLGEDKVSSASQSAISVYSNIFTQDRGKIFIHADIPGGKPAEQRIAFAKLFMYGKYLTGETSLPLADLTTVCNQEGYRCKNGNKTTKVQSGDFQKSLLSKSNKNIFSLHRDEDNALHVSLTELGVRKIQALAETLNAMEFEEESTGRTKDVIFTLKKEGWNDENAFISVKKLGKLCSKYGYRPALGDLRRTLSSSKSRKFFLFDKKRDCIRLSPIGIKIAHKADNHIRDPKKVNPNKDSE